jgi:nucleoid-associated protein YgaU
MPVEVSVNLPLDANAAQDNQPVNRTRMTIIPEGASSGFSVRYAPREADFNDLSATWDVVVRTGRMPLIVRSGDPQTRMSFTLTFGDPNPDVAVSAELRTLTQYARMNTRLRVVYSSWEAGLWRITSMAMHSTQRHPDTNEITRATVDVEFTLASDITTNIGPVSGGVYTPAGSGLTAIAGGTSGGVRKYTVKKGDTLHKIAIKFYRNSSKWRSIAKANKIKNPRKNRQMRVGRVLRIP